MGARSEQAAGAGVGTKSSTRAKAAPRAGSGAAEERSGLVLTLLAAEEAASSATAKTCAASETRSTGSAEYSAARVAACRRSAAKKASRSRFRAKETCTRANATRGLRRGRTESRSARLVTRTSKEIGATAPETGARLTRGRTEASKTGGRAESTCLSTCIAVAPTLVVISEP